MKKVLLMLAVLFVGCNAYARTYNQARHDSDAGSIITIDTNHARIHDGNMFQVSSNTGTIANGTSTFFLIDMTSTTVTRDIHLVYQATTGGESLVELIENMTFVSSGTLVTAYNMDRDTTRTCQAGIKFYSGATNTKTNGTVIFKSLTPGGTSTPSRNGITLRNTSEWILKPGNSYVGRITNLSGGDIDVGINVEFYEAE